MAERRRVPWFKTATPDQRRNINAQAFRRDAEAAVFRTTADPRTNPSYGENVSQAEKQGRRNPLNPSGPKDRDAAMQRFREVDRSIPTTPQVGVGALASPQVRAAMERQGFSPSALVRPEQARVPGAIETAVDVAGPFAQAPAQVYGGMRQALLGAGTADTPQGSLRQAVSGFLGEETYDEQDLGFARLLPEGSRSREIAGTVAGMAVDPLNIAASGALPAVARALPATGRGAGTLRALLEPMTRGGFGRNLAAETALGSGVAIGTEELIKRDVPAPLALAGGLALGAGGLAAGRAAVRGGRALADDVAETAIRQAEGPLDAGLDALPLRVQDGVVTDPVIPGVTPRGRSNVSGSAPVAGTKRTPFKDVLTELTPDELKTPRSIGQGLLRRYEGRTSTYGVQVRRELDDGNRLLREVNIGKPGPNSRVVERTPEVEQLYRALHGSGTPPPRLQAVYDELKQLVDAETQATLDFDQKFMAHPDYFPRGWKTVEVGKPGSAQNAGGAMGATPGFAKPRVEATFDEILSNIYTRPDGSTYRLEPVSWNPFEQMALRRVAGVEFREQKDLIDYLKQSGVAVVADGPLPEGYRIPRVGPAFEGKPQIAPDVDGGAPRFYGYTDRIAVPNRVADTLENMYGAPMSLGKIGPVDVLRTLRQAGQGTKRAKLFGSLFQHVDFATRTGFATFGGAIDDLLAGKPVSAIGKTIRLPAEIGRMVYASTSPARRAALRDQILSTKPIFPDRPGITLRGISEAGWSTQDLTILPRDIKSQLRDIQPPAGATREMIRNGTRNAARIEAAMQRGLFDGVYPQAQIVGLKNLILPRLIRQHPDWTDAQIMANAATEVNKMFSTMGNWQQIVQNRGAREVLRNLIFSTNETEGLLRGAASTLRGPNKQMWAEFYLGGFAFLALVANTVHMAATGEPLPFDRYNPVGRDPYSPLGIGYNNRFVSPDVPGLRGRNNTPVTVDTMGQMDTALRFLDPVGAITSRFSVPARAAINQATGTDFYGRPLEGPVERGAQLASDLGMPIGGGSIAGALGVGPENEARLGTGGQLAQSSGVNFKAETNQMMEDRFAQQFAQQQGMEASSLDDLAEQMGLTVPNLRRQMEQAFPEFAEERRLRRAESAEANEGVAESIRAEERRSQVAADQERDDQRVQSGDISWDQWRDNRTVRLAELRGFNQAVYGDGPVDEPKNARDRFINALIENTDGEEVDWDALDAWVAQQPPADQKFIEDNTGLYATPLEKERRVVANQLEQAGYFDLRDQAWDRLTTMVTNPEYAQILSGFESMEDLKRQLVKQETQRYIDAGVEPGIARARAETSASSHPFVERYSAILRSLNAPLIRENPELFTEAIGLDLVPGTLLNIASATGQNLSRPSSSSSSSGGLRGGLSGGLGSGLGGGLSGGLR